jgi:uncharacterized protein YdhG (YjbR/CyaY superfamily)
MNSTILEYNNSQQEQDKLIFDMLAKIIDDNLPELESKVWHRHPVWFDNGNPIVGYAKQKNSTVLLFWSGQTFGKTNLKATGSFKMGQLEFTNVDQIQTDEVEKLLQKAIEIQWDYKNIVKRKGVLERLK